MVNVVGQKFNMLTVLEMTRKNNEPYCVCQCECGNIKTIGYYCLKYNRTKSCGCLQKKIASKTLRKDLTGQRFGRWTVIKKGESAIDKRGYPVTRWICDCDCGTKGVLVRTSTLTSGGSKSCGCLSSETAHNLWCTDLTGQRFGKWNVLEQVNSRSGSSQWLCECDCGTKRIVLGQSLKRGASMSCGCETMSHGEILIKQYLDEHNIDYLQEYSFDDCIFNEKGILRFDFAILKNGKVFLLLEYDGIQHFEPVEHFGGEEIFKIQKKRDKIKDEYCKINNLKLIRIPYYYSNEETINQLNILKL